MAITTVRLPEIANSLEKVKAAARHGLSREQKTLSPWLFYDEEGSRLFERITELDEYYVTRTERAILEDNADEIVRAACGDRRARVIELGAGSGVKTELVLRALLRRQTSLEYLPSDVSPSALEEMRMRLEEKTAHLKVEPRVENYTSGIAAFPRDGISALVLWIGSSIGNFNPQDAEQVLTRLRARMYPGDALLLGVDKVKAEPLLLAAYNDAAGVTEAFNKNVLVRLNRELGANFDVDGFDHRGIWNAKESRIEMHLVSRHAQVVELPATGQTIILAAGESIHTENSYKYTTERVAALLESADFSLQRTWTDPRDWFGLHLAVVK